MENKHKINVQQKKVVIIKNTQEPLTIEVLFEDREEIKNVSISFRPIKSLITDYRTIPTALDYDNLAEINKERMQEMYKKQQEKQQN